MKKILCVLIVMCMFMLSACSNEEEGGASDATTMYVEMTTAPVGMHPLKTNDSPSTAVNGQIFETLYDRSEDGKSYEPNLASELPVFSEDGLTATIKLREGVKFQDGSAFTADDVAYMIDSLKDPDYGSMRPSIVESIDSYEIVDDLTIDLHLKYVDGVLVAKLAHENSCIVNPELDESKDLMVDPSGAGTGPYEFSSAVSGSSYVLVANDEYWGGEPAVKTLQFDVVADESTALARLQTGEADLFTGISANTLSTASEIEGYTVVNKENSSINYLALRSSEDTAINPLMANLEFRKAIIEAIDFDTYIDTMLGDIASRSQSIVGPTLVGYTEAMEDAGYKYDFEDAKKIVEDNGWEGETITLYTSTTKAHQDMAVYIQSELAKVGLNVEIVQEEWASYLNNAREDKKLDMSLFSWANVTGDGQQMLEPNFSTANGKRVKYNNAEFDALVEESVMTTDLKEREEAMLKAVEKIQGDAITTPTYSQNSIYIYNSKKFDNVILDAAAQYNIFDVQLASE